MAPATESIMGSLPPAKAGQVRRLVNARLFWGDCRRARAVELLHPLLSQPVMEHCLGLPMDVLTEGPRDRGLARRAFQERLPEALLQRRSKGDLSRFYCRTVRESAPFLRSWLMDGRLATEGLITRQEVEAGLGETSLIRDPRSNRFLVLAVLEAWVRRWERRVARVRARQPAVQPVDDPGVQVP